MAGKISELTAATTLNSADQVEVLQGGTNKSVTRLVERNTSRWMVLSSGYVTTPPSTSTITVTSAAASGIVVGTPLRFKNSSVSYYCIVTAIAGDVTLTIAGAPLVASASWIQELAVGRLESVVQIPLFIHATGYAASTGNKLASIGNQYVAWRGPKAYLVQWSATHRTATAPAINMQVNAANVGTVSLTLSATAGTWTAQSAVGIDTAAYDINIGEAIEINVTSAVASSDYLSVMAVFVLE